MHIYKNTDLLPAFRRAVITIGTFDGVHTGHQQILEQLRQEAARIDGETVIITFHPHPRKIVKGATADIRLLNTLREKIELLSWNGIDHLVIVPFTEAFSQLTAEQYVKEFLLEKFHPHTIIIGYDHQFGKGRKGDYHLLEDFSRQEGFRLQEIPVHLLNEISVSSTRIREAITRADLDTANRLLGYDFFFAGRVVEGNKLGRTIGYPTANLQVEDAEKLIPGDGVYAVEAAEIPDWEDDSTAAAAPGNSATRWKGMMNIGMRPTVDGTRRVIEVNIFDFNSDIYGRLLRVFVKKHLRGEQKFAGLDALKQQLAKDKVAAEESLKLLADSYKPGT
ncbi:bifunctional riboflavin kinase/FAD synthetase [Flavitalea sp. BT771]|uniref:bifunctional riboflavin kinase/FAD synthetase n=1 Tax=Flavitalea sp. BT771 TaxID=3063329 RepID=UPI0026E1B4A9|nr:bifunctional riboflavin kinase/FAD synthetase [Flavitalea sp. BT771]MDO6434680.1 bifunctional riboflavin kinase/FAD synthetase [Flavitalea sp. BT771]MDV6223580.1 bifunctional riboflavin kinase/FAD synthetase [Flavitalea sp. BT771]